jgi:hypothetical protein
VHSQVLDLVHALVEHGADPNETSRMGTTALGPGGEAYLT